MSERTNSLHNSGAKPVKLVKDSRLESGKMESNPRLEPAKSPRDLPPIPGKRYFTIGEVSELCNVKQHVLRYWEQEFTQLRPLKRRGNRRYYQREDVIMVRQIRSLLYEQGFTIGGARQRLGVVSNENPNMENVPPVEKNLLRQIRIELEEILELLESS